MQAVVPAGLVVKHERGGLILPRLVADFQESRMVLRISRSVFTEGFCPAICNFGEMRIGASPEFNDYFWKRVREIFVIADAEAIPLHNDLTAKMVFMAIQRDKGSAFGGR